MNGKRRGREEQFEELITRSERGQLDFNGLRQLAQLYRVHCSKLSQLRATTRDPEQIFSLNALCLRAYQFLYAQASSSQETTGGRGVRLWLAEIPAALGRSLRLQGLAVALLAIGALIGATLVLEDSASLSAIVPSQMYEQSALQRLYDSPEARAAFLSRHEVSGATNTLFASSLFSHNTRVGVLSLGAGIAGGLPSALLLLYNGLTLGGFAAIFLRGPEWLDFVAWILPHAIAELLAIVLCSTAGLGLGLAVLAPGRLGRGRALQAAGRTALCLLIASVPLFFCAAAIESFVRESALSTGIRFTVAGLSVAVLAGYVLLVRHLARRQAVVDVSFLHAAAGAIVQTNPAARIAK